MLVGGVAIAMSHVCSRGGTARNRWYRSAGCCLLWMPTNSNPKDHPLWVPILTLFPQLLQVEADRATQTPH